MYPKLLGDEIYEKDVAKINVGVGGAVEEVVHLELGGVGSHDLMLVVMVGFNYYCGYGFVSFHICSILAYPPQGVKYFLFLSPLGCHCIGYALKSD